MLTLWSLFLPAFKLNVLHYIFVRTAMAIKCIFSGWAGNTYLSMALNMLRATSEPTQLILHFELSMFKAKDTYTMFFLPYDKVFLRDNTPPPQLNTQPCTINKRI